MKNILYITYGDPEQKSSGNEQRTHLLYRSLQTIGSVYVVQLVENGIGRVRDRYYRCLLAQPSRIKKLVNLAVYHTLHRISRGYIEAYLPFSLVLDVQRCFPGVKFDFVVKRYLSHLCEAHLWNIAPLYVDIDDHPRQVFDTFVRSRTGWRRHCLVWLQRFYLGLVERHVAGGWIANASQVGWSHFKTPVRYLPNLPQLPSETYDANAKRENYIFTIGLMAYRANYEGVDRFLEEFWPSVHQVFPDLSFYICGKGAPQTCIDRWVAQPGVRVLGFVEDKENLYAKAIASVVPIWKGGGTCLKTLESMAYGRVCLSTPFGARGLPTGDVSAEHCGVLAFHDAKTFVDQLSRVMMDVAFRTRLESASRQYCTERYSVGNFQQSVREVLVV